MSKLLYITLITSLFLLPFPAPAPAQEDICQILPNNGDTGEYTNPQLQTLISQVTVKIITDKNRGSGTILGKQRNKYLVITNAHVVMGNHRVTLQTIDKQTYSAQIIPNPNLEKFDLALIEFSSVQNYCTRTVTSIIPEINTNIMAAGYTSQSPDILYRPGKVEQIPDKPLKDGYQIGYTSDIIQGMSGGPILNNRGEIVGINGKTAYPIFNSGLIYADGNKPSAAEIAKMRTVSWGIPVFRFLQQVQETTLTAYNLPLPKGDIEVATAPLTGWLGELEAKAKQITVRIDSSSGANGSGVIIGREGNSYTVLTAAHVVCEKNVVLGEENTSKCAQAT